MSNDKPVTLADLKLALADFAMRLHAKWAPGKSLPEGAWTLWQELRAEAAELDKPPEPDEKEEPWLLGPGDKLRHVGGAEAVAVTGLMANGNHQAVLVRRNGKLKLWAAGQFVRTASAEIKVGDWVWSNEWGAGVVQYGLITPGHRYMVGFENSIYRGIPRDELVLFAVPEARQ